MKKYKVLWFDDEHEKFSSIKDEALLENVQLIGFSNSEEGCPELRANYMYYDAIILDIDCNDTELGRAVKKALMQSVVIEDGKERSKVCQESVLNQDIIKDKMSEADTEIRQKYPQYSNISDEFLLTIFTVDKERETSVGTEMSI